MKESLGLYLNAIKSSGMNWSEQEKKITERVPR